MKSRRKKKQSYVNKSAKKFVPGTSPGHFHEEELSTFPNTNVIFYNEVEVKAIQCSSVSDLEILLAENQTFNKWIEVKGKPDLSLIKYFSRAFGVHRLEIEDVINTGHSPKIDFYPDHIFVITRLVFNNEESELKSEQVSFFMANKILISIQESDNDHFDSVKKRLDSSGKLIRKSNTDYLMYALQDSVIDMFYPVIDSLGEKLERMEDSFFSDEGLYSISDIQDVKKQLLFLRRTLVSEREKVNELLRSDSDIFGNESKLYLRDVMDHVRFSMDVLESYKEISGGLIEIHLSNSNNRMNSVMKVLTIISTIFIPLTFIAGIYGMNFPKSDPISGEEYFFNMPEMYHPYSYITVLLVMLVLVILQLYMFYRRGWLSK
ncbi:MAG TPA: magnesium/cobalt transporter CorA [Bacteroidia bacterium]|nr:magnesium/cobalt transporter CorA [Bacteroidia bacterium]HNT81123.1 magnesium/cobalt transporter CorA [Bacteroidia bacterium]